MHAVRPNISSAKVNGLIGRSPIAGDIGFPVYVPNWHLPLIVGQAISLVPDETQVLCPLAGQAGSGIEGEQVSKSQLLAAG